MTKGGALLACVGVGLAIAACSSNPSPQASLERPAELELDPIETEIEIAFAHGLAALKVGDYETARRSLERVAYGCAGAPIGSRALMTLIAVELDPRNPTADLREARRLAARYIALPEKPAWTEPAIESLYLVALELGGSEISVAAEDSTGEATVDPAYGTAPVGIEAVPNDGDPLAGRGTLAHDPSSSCMNAQPDPLVGELAQPDLPHDPIADRLGASEADRVRLQRRVGTLEVELAELQQELARIRETLKP